MIIELLLRRADWRGDLERRFASRLYAYYRLRRFII